MRRMFVGVSLVAGLLLATLAWATGRNPVLGQQAVAAQSVGGGELLAFTSPSGKVAGGQQLIVLDPRTRSLAVYTIAAETGEVALKSVRQLHWDLQLEEFNGASPTPGEIRAMLEPR